VVARSLPQHLLDQDISVLNSIGTRTAIWRQKLCTSKLIKLSTYKTFATKLIGITRLV
jgi:hypothetical protein